MTVDSRQARILIVAGEASGDLHAANLIRAARELDPGLSFFGVTGEKMRQAGCETLLPSEQIAVMGLVEVVRHLPAIRRAFYRVTATFHGPNRPDLLVLVDFPGFNMRLARAAKQAGIPVLYYITPKVWAWRRGRAKKLAQITDRLAVIFPFEPKIFRTYGAEVDYVGNPLLDEFAEYKHRVAETRPYAVPGKTLVGLFPGSRRSEIRFNLETMLETAGCLVEQHPGMAFLMPLASSLCHGDLSERIDASGLPIRLIADDIYGVAASCNAVLAVSGTVTLQVALTGTPLAVMYKMAPLSFAIAKRVVKLKCISLVNIVAGRRVVSELLQYDASPKQLSRELLKILEDHNYSQNIIDGLNDVARRLGDAGSSRRVARILLEMLDV